MTSESQNAARAGSVCILGRPNVGKSTLLNAIVGEKLAIVTPKPQTTRNRIVGVWNGPAGQIVFVDTPGVHEAKMGLNRFMLEEALGAIADVEAALLVVDIYEEGPGPSEKKILRALADEKKPIVLAINKVDKAKDKSTVLPLLAAWQGVTDFAAMVPISALKGTNVNPLVAELLKILPEGPALYGPEMLTDRTERFLVTELVREQLFLRLRQEVPYATAVVIENWQERDRNGVADVVIEASILVERESQKGIVVGKGGAMIRDVGIAARTEITQLLGRPAHLKLEVKVVPDWTTSPEALDRLGYRA
ncbi:MAG TPA: GTPase Era [Polyangia bacterium]|jgi:GTP-binding protein Era|nr:GTPase Era [Polyangia bacterium]